MSIFRVTVDLDIRLDWALPAKGITEETHRHHLQSFVANEATKIALAAETIIGQIITQARMEEPER